MRKNRRFVEGAMYHVTSRTNDKARVFEGKVGQKILMTVLHQSKMRFGFRLLNFCVMPNHFHWLILPDKTAGSRGDLPQIMHWIKLSVSKWWNEVHGSSGHLWGNRYFARIVNDPEDFFTVMRYIDCNPVKAKLAVSVGDWKLSGAYHLQHGFTKLVDCFDGTRYHCWKE
jgi:putative transposase